MATGILMNLAILIAFTIILVIGSELLIRAVSKLSIFLKLKEFLVAFLILGFATSLPELSICINSALKRDTSIAMGVILGSNITDLTLVAGITVLIGGSIFIKRKEIFKDNIYMILIASTPIILIIDGVLNWIDGIILLSVFVLYAIHEVRNPREKLYTNKNSVTKTKAVGYLLLLILSLGIVFFSANMIVGAAEEISYIFGIAAMTIGVLLAIGTTLPELTIGIVAVREKKSDITLGDLIGSVVANLTVLLGVTALIYPITANYIILLISIVYLFLAMGLFTVFARTGRVLTWKEGLILLFAYITFIIIEVLLGHISAPIIG